MVLKYLYKSIILLFICSCTSHSVRNSNNDQTRNGFILKDILVRGKVFYSNQALENVDVLQVTVNQLHPAYLNIFDCGTLDSYVDGLLLVKDWNINIDSLNFFSVMNIVKTNSSGDYEMLVESDVMKHTTFFNTGIDPFYAFIFFVFRKEGYKSEVIPFAPECLEYNLQNVELKAIK